MFEAVAVYLEARGALLRGGTIVDATLIAASPSTKNEAGKRDPQMHSSKKGNHWYFGMKAHVGVDAISGLVHTAGVTSGNVHDAKMMDRCCFSYSFPPYPAGDRVGQGGLHGRPSAHHRIDRWDDATGETLIACPPRSWWTARRR